MGSPGGSYWLNNNLIEKFDKIYKKSITKNDLKVYMDESNKEYFDDLLFEVYKVYSKIDDSLKDKLISYLPMDIFLNNLLKKTYNEIIADIERMVRIVYNKNYFNNVNIGKLSIKNKPKEENGKIFLKVSVKDQTGGDYYEKYMKYKTKYLELKKIRDSKLNY